MFKRLDLSNQELAQLVLSLQIPAYQLEANLIGFQGIPALLDTVDDLMNNKENFIGFYKDDELLGVLSYEETDELVDICRLVVSPASFRKGIGNQLVNHVLEEVRGSREVIVSTGLENVPAVTLYKKFGFQQERLVEIVPGVKLVNMRYSDK